MGKNRKAGFPRVRKIFALAAVLAGLSFVLYPFISYGQQAKIKDILITRDAQRVLVYAMLSDCFTREMEAAIRAGVPTMFTFLIDLYEGRPKWFDRKVTRVTINHTLKYDNVKNIFYVYMDDRQEAGFPDLKSAKRAMAELNGVPVIAVTSLQKGGAYYIRMKAKLDKVRLPLHMEYVFFFVSLWDFETDWVEKGLPVNYEEKS